MSTSGVRSPYQGVLFIGDPHLEGRQPGFRKDDYPNVILGKIEWCLDYARNHALLPAFLGDVFDKPRDNPTWMLGRLIDMLGPAEAIGIYGNHDCADPEISDNDSLMLLFKAGRLRRVSADDPWRGRIGGRTVLIGGSSYREPFPEGVVGEGDHELGVWLGHHDIIAPGYEEQGRVRPRELPGIDLVVNGHIHRRLGEVVVGRTRWVTPGNISRRSRSDATRDHVPSVLRMDMSAGGEDADVGDYTLTWVTVPHAPFEEVFHPVVGEEETGAGDSAFVTGLAELQARRTDSGAGFRAFIDANAGEFDAEVAEEIRKLAEEVTRYGT